VYGGEKKKGRKKIISAKKSEILYGIIETCGGNSSFLPGENKLRPGTIVETPGAHLI